MSTCLEVVTRALREIGVLSQNQNPNTFQGTQGLADMKAMIAGWELDSIALPDPSAWELSTSIPLPENHTDALVYNLAVREAPKYGKAPSQITAAFALGGYRNLQNAYGGLIDMTTDRGFITYRNW